PPSSDYRKNEGEQIQALLYRSILERRPDLMIIGRETFALHVPDIARKDSIPTILLIHGTTIAGIHNKTLPEDTARTLLQQFRKTDLVIAVARNLAESMRHLGLDRIMVIENAVDEETFHPAPKNEALLEEYRIPKDH